MMRIVQFILLVMLLFVVIAIAAFVYLQWWQALLVVLAMIAAAMLGVRYLIRNLGRLVANSMVRMFDIKSRVLRGADVEVHSVQPAMAPPRGGNETSEDAGAARGPVPPNYYRLDLTIKPRADVSGPMMHWDLDDLRLVAYDAPAKTLTEMKQSNDREFYELSDVKVLQDGQFVEDQPGECQGAKHVSGVVAVPAHIRRLKFQYYAEQFGDIVLPPPLPAL